MNERTLQQIAPRSYWLPPDSATDRPLLGVVAGARGALIVDAGNSPAHAGMLQAELAARGIRPHLCALTHWHWDHVFGAAALGLPAIAQRETARIVRVLAGLSWSDAALDARVAAGTEIAFCRDMLRAELPDRSGLVLALPELIFERELTIDLGDLTCQILHVGGDHAHDSSVVFVPAERVAFLGDCIYHDLHHGESRLTTRELFPLLDRLLALDADFYLAGHQPPMSRAELEAEAALLRTVGAAVDRIGDDQAAVFAELRALLAAPPTEEHFEIADAFLAGLRMPYVASVL